MQMLPVPWEDDQHQPSLAKHEAIAGQLWNLPQICGLQMQHKSSILGSECTPQSTLVDCTALPAAAPASPAPEPAWSTPTLAALVSESPGSASAPWPSLRGRKGEGTENLHFLLLFSHTCISENKQYSECSPYSSDRECLGTNRFGPGPSHLWSQFFNPGPNTFWCQSWRWGLGLGPDSEVPVLVHNIKYLCLLNK